MQTAHLSEQEILRCEKLEELKKLGIDPYPAALYPVSHYSTEIKSSYNDENKDAWTHVCLAGRIMSIRDMGKATFAVLQDSPGRIQAIYSQETISAKGEDKSFMILSGNNYSDIGDLIGVKGFVFITKTGETSVHVTEFNLLAKSLSPLPIVKETEGANLRCGH